MRLPAILSRGSSRKVHASCRLASVHWCSDLDNSNKTDVEPSNTEVVVLFSLGVCVGSVCSMFAAGRTSLYIDSKCSKYSVI